MGVGIVTVIFYISLALSFFRSFAGESGLPAIGMLLLQIQQVFQLSSGLAYSSCEHERRDSYHILYLASHSKHVNHHPHVILNDANGFVHEVAILENVVSFLRRNSG